ncbi:MAG: ABC transporter permease subunit [Rhodoferax sp.]|nr:ABC transporter permease subunit [Actinomycetota bacterium]
MTSRVRGGALLGVAPFLAFTTIFLAVPTLVVVVGAFVDTGGRPTLANVAGLRQGYILDALLSTLELSLTTAVIGAVVGALLAYAVVTAAPDGMLRRSVSAVCGVLAQFGGVTLAFAFLATVGSQGFVTLYLFDHTGLAVPGDLLYGLRGLGLVYVYFQIPLMVIVFLPALDGVRVQWREATESLGGSTWQYWRHVAGPLLMPASLGSTLLLFANAFAAYATAAALVSQGSPILPLVVRATFTSEVVLGQANLGKAIALAMVVVVAVVMTGYAWLQRRTSRWVG